MMILTIKLPSISIMFMLLKCTLYIFIFKTNRIAQLIKSSDIKSNLSRI